MHLHYDSQDQMVVIQANPELDTGNQYGVMRESVPNNPSISQ